MLVRGQESTKRCILHNGPGDLAAWATRCMTDSHIAPLPYMYGLTYSLCWVRPRGLGNKIQREKEKENTLIHLMWKTSFNFVYYPNHFLFQFWHLLLLFLYLIYHTISYKDDQAYYVCADLFLLSPQIYL